ncbi:hypothetical protein NPX13_g2115 [Xylaria arbuscula]|uniref:Uncharacterized protein n=1 Tax=Xylaria arbuscula TaxID=114810 RepID=A0A9W8NKF4_9PEZI|nr:hypothetical protein NPX13_g2115 [Xylaria arbuscula]
MSRQAMRGQGHILRALSQWPKDTIRPEVQFQVVLQKRFEQPKLELSEDEQLKQANALYSLLDNRYKKTVSAFKVDIQSLSEETLTSFDITPVSHHRLVTPAQEQPDLFHRPDKRARGSADTVLLPETLVEGEGIQVIHKLHTLLIHGENDTATHDKSGKSGERATPERQHALVLENEGRAPETVPV